MVISVPRVFQKCPMWSYDGSFSRRHGSAKGCSSFINCDISISFKLMNAKMVFLNTWAGQLELKKIQLEGANHCLNSGPLNTNTDHLI